MLSRLLGTLCIYSVDFEGAATVMLIFANFFGGMSLKCALVGISLMMVMIYHDSITPTKNRSSYQVLMLHGHRRYIIRA